MQEKLYLKDSSQHYCFAVPGCVQPSQAPEKPRITALPEIITAPGSTLKVFGEMFDRFKSCLLLMYMELQLYLGIGKIPWVKRYSVLQEFPSDVIFINKFNWK